MGENSFSTSSTARTLCPSCMVIFRHTATENKTHVLATYIFWQQHNRQYALQIYSMTEGYIEIVPQHLIGRFLVQIPLMRLSGLWYTTSLRDSRLPLDQA